MAAKKAATPPAKKAPAKKAAAKAAPPKPAAKKAAKADKPGAPWQQGDMINPTAQSTPTTAPPPKPQLTAEQKQDVLNRWYVLHQHVEQQLKPIIEQERALRRELIDAYFPEPKEGSNKADIGGGWTLEHYRWIDYQIDEAVVPAVTTQLPPGFLDHLLRYKPELQLKNYRTLPKEYKDVFDQCVISKPGSPSVKLVAPKSEP